MKANRTLPSGLPSRAGIFGSLSDAGFAAKCGGAKSLPRLVHRVAVRRMPARSAAAKSAAMRGRSQCQQAIT